jgi:hypothetical protein
MAKGTWLKRFLLGLFAAITALLFAKKKAAAPGGKDAEFKLAPVPDARASGPEDATPLTEDEQKMMAERAPDFKGFSAPPHAGVPIEKTSDSGNLTGREDDSSADRQGIGGSGETPPPISYEIAKQNADNADALREAGDSEGADALEKRIYFTAPDKPDGDVPPPISHEIAQENADNADTLREAGDDEGAEALEQRVYFTAPEASTSDTPLPVAYALADDNAEYAEVPPDTGNTDGDDALEQREFFGASAHSAEREHGSSGDTTPEPTSEAFDVITDGADHTGQDAAEIEDPTEVGLDIDVDLDDEDDESTAPELTSEAFDGGKEALGIAAGQPENIARGFITVSDEQDWCPDEFPIKGNASSRIYHKPGESSYDATNPEICFASDEAAAAQGFRPRKR